MLEGMLSETVTYRSNYPNEKISRDEARKIMSGQIKTMNHIKSFFLRAGEYFYDLGGGLQRVYDRHRDWQFARNNSFDYRTPMNLRDISEDDDTPRPISFFDCRIAASENLNPSYKLLVGKSIVSESPRDSVFTTIIGFCYQLAFDLFNDRVYRDLEYRRELHIRLKTLGGPR